MMLAPTTRTTGLPSNFFFITEYIPKSIAAVKAGPQTNGEFMQPSTNDTSNTEVS
jgi:hypothetical protein